MGKGEEGRGMPGHPDFVCIGAHKAATTWLYSALSRTPGVFVPGIKELHYFSQLHHAGAGEYGPSHRRRQVSAARAYFLEQAPKTEATALALKQLDHLEQTLADDAWYTSVFSFARDRDVTIDVCPSYMLLPDEGVRHVLRVNPSVRVLLIVRDPIDRAWSHVRAWIRNGHLKHSLSALAHDEHALDPFIEYTQYAPAIARWEKHMGPERMMLVPYDRIGADPQGALQDVLEFMDRPLNAPPDDLGVRVHEGIVGEFPPELRAALFRRLMPQYEFLRPRFPDTVDCWLKSHAQAVGRAD